MSDPSLDEIDRKIISLLQEDSTKTHSQIAKELDRSQPAIGARIKKMIDKGILATQIGVDFAAHDVGALLNLVIVLLDTSQPDEVFSMVKHCPYMLNALKLSGEFNIMLFLSCSSLKRLDCLLDQHFRNKSYIKKLQMNLCTGLAKKLILPYDFGAESFENPHDPCDFTSCPYCSQQLVANKTEKT